MNFKELFWMLGFKPKTKEYGNRQDRFVPGEQYRREMYQFLKGFGYNLYYFKSHVHFQGQELKEENMMKWKHFDIYAKP